MAPSTTSRRRILLAALAAAALPLAVTAAVPVALYPVQSEGLTDGERSEVQAVVESALATADRRGVLEPRSPLVTPAPCRPPITVGCVATQAKGGVILYAKAKRRGAQILVTVLFVDAVGRKTRAAAFPVDLFIQNLRPANDAIATIEAELASGALEDPAPPPPASRPPGERPKAAERTAPPARVAPKPPPEPPPPVERPAVAAVAPEPPPPEPPPPEPPKAAPPTPPAVAELVPEPAPPTTAPRAEPAPHMEPVPHEPAGASVPSLIETFCARASGATAASTSSRACSTVYWVGTPGTSGA